MIVGNEASTAVFSSIIITVCVVVCIHVGQKGKASKKAKTRAATNDDDKEGLILGSFHSLSLSTDILTLYPVHESCDDTDYPIVHSSAKKVR